jgi:hypothetical protein
MNEITRGTCEWTTLLQRVGLFMSEVVPECDTYDVVFVVTVDHRIPYL